MSMPSLSIKYSHPTPPFMYTRCHRQHTRSSDNQSVDRHHSAWQPAQYYFFYFEITACTPGCDFNQSKPYDNKKISTSGKNNDKSIPQTFMTCGGRFILRIYLNRYAELEMGSKLKIGNRHGQRPAAVPSLQRTSKTFDTTLNPQVFGSRRGPDPI